MVEPTPLKNMLFVKMGSSSPFLGVKIKKSLKPPPSQIVNPKYDCCRQWGRTQPVATRRAEQGPGHSHSHCCCSQKYEKLSTWYLKHIDLSHTYLYIYIHYTLFIVVCCCLLLFFCSCTNFVPHSHLTKLPNHQVRQQKKPLGVCSTCAAPATVHV